MAKIGIRSVAFSFMLMMLMISLFSLFGRLRASPILSFISNTHGNRDIFLLDTRTRLVHNLTQSPTADDWSYVWSQDGRQIIYTIAIDSGDDLFVMDAVGRNRRLVQGLRTQQAFNLTWSNDGQSLVYFSSYQNTSDLYLISLANNTVTNITQSENLSEAFPDWSPNGSNLLFFLQGDMYLRDMQDDSITRITDSPAAEEYPVWSPDGSQIVFQRVDRMNGKRHLYLLDIASGDIRQLETMAAPRAQPVSWSPDSRFITLTLDTQQVIILDVESGAIQILTEGFERTLSAVWSRMLATLRILKIGAYRYTIYSKKRRFG
ncbi:MAG: DPP IV N-terminal domain-containing protein [Anaerolineae bacterium]|nr:DPP IV N-terminal domain-containing protein [Anaerolineae bacterium]